MYMSKTRFFSAVLLASFTLAACNKSTPPPIVYSISGVEDVFLSENGSKTLSLEVKHESGTLEPVTLSMEGLPPGVSADFSTSVNSPDYKSSLYLKDDSAKGGIHNVTLKGRSARGVVKNYNFELTTLDKTCARKAAGAYDGATTCTNSGGQVLNPFYFAEDPKNIDRLLFTWNNYPAYLIINCNREKFSIPLQSVGSYRIEGEGNFSLNYTVMEFNYQELHKNGDIVNCSAKFVKK